jgi:hypothetical protein
MDRERSVSKVMIDPTAQMRLGERIRSHYDLTRPLPDKLHALMTRLDDPDLKIRRPITGALVGQLRDDGSAEPSLRSERLA